MHSFSNATGRSNPEPRQAGSRSLINKNPSTKHSGSFMYLQTTLGLIYIFWERKWESTPMHWYASHICTMSRIGLGPKLGARNTIHIFCMGRMNPVPWAITAVSQNTSWQEAGVKSQNRELDPGTLMLVIVILTAVVNIPCWKMPLKIIETELIFHHG